MKRTFLSLALLFYAGFIFPQDTGNPADTVKYWKTGGQIGLSFSQVSLTNWAAGGENSLSTNGLLRLTAVYKKNKSLWDSYFLAGYGFSKQGDRKFIKNDDKMELFSKYGYQAGKSWYYSAVVNFRSQFTPGYSDPYEQVIRISDFFSPAYLTASLGMDYKPNEFFAVFISPATLKMTFVNDDSLSSAGAYGVEPGEKFRAEGGGFIKAIFKKDNLIKNVNLATTLDLFSNYFDHPEKIDVNWEVFIAMKVTQLLTVTLNTQLIYDYDINLQKEKNRAQELITNKWDEFITAGIQKVHEFTYPVKKYPEKIQSMSPEKNPVIESVLTGIRGQYLFFDNLYVINIRNSSGYEIEFFA